MAFDIYAGGFARYFAREWENVMQKTARERGMPYQMIRPDGDAGPAKWEDVQEGVQNWRAAIIQGLRDNAPADLDWDESRNAPYFTDRPGWDGYSALVLMAACAACEEPLPEKLPAEALASPVIERVNAPNFQAGYRSITQVQLWLPGSFNFGFEFVDLCNQKIFIGSVENLVKSLDALSQKGGFTEEEKATALRDNYDDQANCRTIARFGLAVFQGVARQALSHRLPMMLSF